MADRTTDDTRELPQERNVHRRITYENDASEPEEARSMGGGTGPDTVARGGTIGEDHPGNEPVDDATEITAWCDRCDEERRFVFTHLDVAAREEQSESPNVGAALRGEDAWACEVCGKAVRDPIADGAYEFQYSNVGHHVRPFAGDEVTVREAASQGVEPARGVRGHGTNPDEGGASERGAGASGRGAG